MAEEGGLLVYYRELMNRTCKDCRICDYRQTMAEDDPDIERNPVNFVFDIKRMVRLCPYCFHICYHPAGSRLFNTYVNVYHCDYCTVCIYYRNPALSDNPHKAKTVISDVLQICGTCFHVGCRKMECNYFSTTTSSDRPRKLHTRSDDTKADMEKCSNLELDPGTPGSRILLDTPESRKSTTDTRSDDTRNDMEKMSDPLRSGQDLPRSSSQPSTSYKSHDVQARTRQLKITETADEASNDNQDEMKKMSDPGLDPPGSSSQPSTSWQSHEVEPRTRQPKITEAAGEASNDNQDPCPPSRFEQDLPGSSSQPSTSWKSHPVDRKKCTLFQLDTPESSSVESSGVTPSEGQIFWTDTRITEENVTTDEAATEGQQFWTDTRITEENVTTDEPPNDNQEASGSKESRTDDPRRNRTCKIRYEVKPDLNLSTTSNDAKRKSNEVPNEAPRTSIQNRVILGVVFGLIVIAALKFGPSRAPNA